MVNDTPLLPRLAFAGLTALTGVLIYGCLTPPHPAPTSIPLDKRKEKSDSDAKASSANTKDYIFRDSFSSPFQFLLIKAGSIAFVTITTWQALYIAWLATRTTSDNITRTLFQPHPHHPLNQTLLTPNLISIPALLTICIAAYIRLRAFASLGSDFTFDLRIPQRLETSGLYSWLQHPSYVGAIVGVGGASMWFIRCDGVMGTILPEMLMRTQSMWNALLPLLSGGFVFIGLWIRVREEEEMLRNAFGKEWEEWHRKTARFIPGVF